MSTPQEPRPGTDELRAAFHARGRAAERAGTAGRARRARALLTVVAAVLALVTLSGLVARLAQGAGAGVWLVLNGAGLVASALAAASARRGRTRWSGAVLVLGYVCVQTGDLLAARALP